MIIVSVTAPNPENPPCCVVIFPNVWGLRMFTAVLCGAEEEGILERRRHVDPQRSLDAFG